MIIVTGGAGMIGSNIINLLNNNGYYDILVVDNLTAGIKFSNLVDLKINDYIDKEKFIYDIEKNKYFNNIEAIFHQGACSSTTEWNGKYVMENNYVYSRKLLNFSINHSIPFLYASSASVYGLMDKFIEHPEYERPLNVYGYSKLLFDNYVRQVISCSRSQICGLRYFNVYGPRENHKGNMSSVAFHLNNQINQGEDLKLFIGSENFKRDFIHVDDVAQVNLWFWQQKISGIFNCGTGKAESFQKIADAVTTFYKKGKVVYIPFPEKLKGRYQSFTKADISKLRAAGYDRPFKTVQQGVTEYLSYLTH